MSMQPPADPKDASVWHVVKSVWGDYDDDNSGTLDKEETRVFVQVALGKIRHTGFSNEVFDV